ncbi:MAG: hypothetical protein GKS03_02055 [Alphaproteobacteria bacterium]|nr:hypothetical protein [Alphaproteobacteria bacterium]
MDSLGMLGQQITEAIFSMSNELQIAHLLCTRLCHDLAGPVGAISAGVELIGTDPSLIDEETLSLLSGSAQAAGQKLKFLRIAFGWSGGGGTKFDDLEHTFEDYLVATSAMSGVPQLDWPDNNNLTLLSEKLGDGAAQILSNIVLLSLECMHSCGALSIDLRSGPAGLEVVVNNRTVEGRASKIREDTAAAMANPDQVPLSAQTVQAHLTHLLVSNSGGRIAVEGDAEGAVVTSKWP